MKPKFLAWNAAALLIAAFIISRLVAAEQQPISKIEYATIRWAGRENTHVIRPGGHVEFVGTELRKVVKPDRTDERAFYMNVVMNGLTKDGFEFAGMTPDEIVMKRTVK
jgi:hypothetical protein